MTLRHAVALALVGWYLMIPPMLPDGTPNLKAPLSQWEQMEDFDNAAACHETIRDHAVLGERLLEQVQKRMESLPDSLKYSQRPLSETAPDLFQADRKATIFSINAMASRCIATDDPRLKGK